MVPPFLSLTRVGRRPWLCFTRCGVRPGWRHGCGGLASARLCTSAASEPAEPQPRRRPLLSVVGRGFFAVAGTCAVGFCYAEEIVSYVREQVAKINGEELRIFDQHFANVMPHGEFEKLMRAGQRVYTTRRHVAIRKGDEHAPLILVIDGTPEVEIDTGITIVGKPGLLGEMSFLTNAPTSATVLMTDGCRYHIWGRGALRALLQQEPLIKAGLEAKAGHDLIDRLTQSTKDLVKSQYSVVLLHTALQYHLQSPKSGSDKFFAELATARKKSGTSDDVHRLVMDDFGINEEEATKDRASIAKLCTTICNREVIQPQPEPPASRVVRIISK